jgi:hypothetical protein
LVAPEHLLRPVVAGPNPQRANRDFTEATQHVDAAPAGDGPEDYDLRTIFFRDGSTVTLKEIPLFDTATKNAEDES